MANYDVERQADKLILERIQQKFNELREDIRELFKQKAERAATADKFVEIDSKLEEITNDLKKIKEDNLNNANNTEQP